MELKMYLGGKEIDSISINLEHLKRLNNFTLDLEDKHSDIIELTDEDPTFYLEGIPSSMNRNRKIAPIVFPASAFN